MSETTTTDTLAHATAIVVACLERHDVPPADLPALIADVRAALEREVAVPAGTAEPGKRQPSRRGRRRLLRSTDNPAVPIAESVMADHIVSLETGQRFKALERHVRSLGLTPAGYRRRWGLPKDYPMAAPNFAAARSAVGRALGRGELAPVSLHPR